MGKKKGDSVVQLKYSKLRSSGVKIDSDLLVEVEAFINLDENKFRYANRKQFIDVAVADYLKKCSQGSTSGEAKK
jgi:hypothetical protein